MILSNDERNLYSSGRDGRINRWNTENGKLMQRFEQGHDDWIGCLAMGPASQ